MKRLLFTLATIIALPVLLPMALIWAGVNNRERYGMGKGNANQNCSLCEYRRECWSSYEANHKSYPTECKCMRFKLDKSINTWSK